MTFSEEEAMLFLTGLSMVAHFLPHFASKVFSFQEKMNGVFPKALVEQAHDLANTTAGNIKPLASFSSFR